MSTLLTLLDSIDADAPRQCMTCLHCGTHKRCDGCLTDGNPWPSGQPFLYRNWEPGNWLRANHAAQIAGEKCIVIGGSGEAEVYADRPAGVQMPRLRNAAEQCGYVCWPVRRQGMSENYYVRYATWDGTFVLWWRDGVLRRIDRVTGDDDAVTACEWHRDYADPEDAPTESTLY